MKTIACKSFEKCEWPSRCNTLRRCEGYERGMDCCCALNYGCPNPKVCRIMGDCSEQCGQPKGWIKHPERMHELDSPATK